jgi:hypothetical protein
MSVGALAYLEVVSIRRAVCTIDALVQRHNKRAIVPAAVCTSAEAKVATSQKLDVVYNIGIGAGQESCGANAVAD